MGKQPRTGVYQFDAFREMEAIRELRSEYTHLCRQEIFYGATWSPEKTSEVKARLSEITQIIKLLGG